MLSFEKSGARSVDIGAITGSAFVVTITCEYGLSAASATVLKT